MNTHRHFVIIATAAILFSLSAANAQVFTVFVNSSSVCATLDDSRLWPAHHVSWYTKSKITELNPIHSYAKFSHDHSAMIRGSSNCGGSLNFYRFTVKNKQGKPGKPLKKGNTLSDTSSTKRSILCVDGQGFQAESYGYLNKTLIISIADTSCVSPPCT